MLRYNQLHKDLQQTKQQIVDMDHNLREYLLDQFHRFNQEISNQSSEQQLKNSQHIQDTLRKSLSHHAETISKQFTNLITTAEQKLQQINNKVEQRLNEGFEKTNETFVDIVKRLGIIDNAQTKLMELSNNVVSLQQILSDKRSRGAFGEIQLQHLIENALPKNSFAFQYTLENGLRADCMLFLPPPTGNIAIDAKFPLENFQRFTSFEASKYDKVQAKQQFKQDVRKHILDIANKYINSGETADGALLFIPAEAIFAEIHSEFPELVELAQQKHVWIASPTTMMAIITTASAVLKDNATREHIHVIQEHLHHLAKDFERFSERVVKLSKHISQANTDVQQVHTSAKKLSSRFEKIKDVELPSTSLTYEE